MLKNFFTQSILSYKALYGYLDLKMYLFFKIVNPTLQLTFFVLLARYIHGEVDLAMWIIGNALILSMYNAFFGVGTFLLSERMFGTLSLIITSPTSNLFIFISRAFIHIFDSCITVCIGLTAGIIFFKVDLSNANLIMLIVCILITMFAAMGLGLLIASVGLLVKDINLILNTSIFLLMLFTGALFPISNLPNFLQFLPNLIPLTRGIEAARNVVSGAGISDIYLLLLGELIIGLAYFIIGYLLMIVMERLSRQNGAIDFY